MKKGVAGSLFGIGLFVGFATWRLSVPEPLPVWRLWLIDRSLSDAEPCLTLGGALQKITTTFPPDPSRWEFFATGSAETAYEPIRFPVHSLPVAQHLMEGKEAADRQNAAFVTDVVKSCESVPRAGRSPIFLGIKHVIAHAQQLPGKVDVSVITDLQETVESGIATALKQPYKTKSRLPEPIDTGTVRLHICGYAQTNGRDKNKDNKPLMPGPGGATAAEWFTAPRSAESVDRLLEVWPALFKKPASVTFSPFCF